MLQAKDITVSFGAKKILDEVSFTAKTGQVTAIVGPNGSGKTTLLRAITGEVPYSGQVLFGDHDIQHMQAWDLASQRAVLSQSTALAFPFTVIEVVRIGLHRSRLGGAEKIAVAALSNVGLAGYANRHYQELSGGEQQRVQLARVLAQVWEPVVDDVPRWLFLDEPVSSLDIGHQLEVMEIMRGFASAGGGVVAVMHDLNLTALYADQIVMMAQGRILANDTPEQALTNENLSTAYNCPIQINRPPAMGVPFVLPQVFTQPEL